MQIRTFRLSYILVISSLLWSCQGPNSSTHTEPTTDPFAHIEDQQANKILKEVMQAMGGLDRWRAKTSISFQKGYALLLENGEAESSAIQQHRYSFHPDHIAISWVKEGQDHVLSQKDGLISKTINGQPDTAANPVSLTNTILSSTFVVDIPFKLLDPGAEISYVGLDTLETGTIVDVIQASYNPTQHENHSTPDIWHLYFNKDSHILTAYMVQHADHYSYVRNLSDTLVDGFTLVKERDSYRVDSLRNLLYLRATYAYSDYQIQWD